MGAHRFFERGGAAESWVGTAARPAEEDRSAQGLQAGGVTQSQRQRQGDEAFEGRSRSARKCM